MKLLLSVSSLQDIEPFIAHYSLQLQASESLNFLFSAKVLQHEVDILECGNGLFQSTYKITKTLSKQKYHLALKMSLGNAYKKEIAVGTVLNIINEKPADFGTYAAGEWKDLYELDLIHRDSEPHVRSGFINMTNAYMNVFMPFKKSVGITVNHFGNTEAVQFRVEKYKADCETTDGMGFVYACLFEKQVFYHLCTTANNLATGESDKSLARQKLNETLIDITAKL
jgi:hypothetical protein